ncbi:MAG: archaellin/type IV pilin N-terminal domain-containing protein, partial [Candidatus Bathyarchaeia archaeon]
MREKPNIKCQKCGHEWHTKSRLKMVTCPSCNQKTPNITLHPRRRVIKALAQSRQAIIGLEAAIVLIAFVIIAAAFSFMVINQGLFATERGKTVVQDSLRQSSTPLIVDGSICLRASSPTTIDAIVIPLRAYGVKYVALGKEETSVTLQVAGSAWP